MGNLLKTLDIHVGPWWQRMKSLSNSRFSASWLSTSWCHNQWCANDLSYDNIIALPIILVYLIVLRNCDCCSITATGALCSMIFNTQSTFNLTGWSYSSTDEQLFSTFVSCSIFYCSLLYTDICKILYCVSVLWKETVIYRFEMLHAVKETATLIVRRSQLVNFMIIGNLVNKNWNEILLFSECSYISSVSVDYSFFWIVLQLVGRSSYLWSLCLW